MLGNSPAYANLPCVDLAGARKFYSETLGLPEIEMSGFEGNAAEMGAMFQCGQGTVLMIYARETPTTADNTAVTWIVDDVDATADHLISQGVKLEVYDIPGIEFDDRGVANISGQKGAWFTDPEGNILSFMSMS
jgi:catechol 2,3-dioxygenase-like lactoylglutathione lyase family enzyme